MGIGQKPRPLMDRFWEKVFPEPNSGCWLWCGALTKAGYGKISLGYREGKEVYAHRLSYETHYGPIPDGLVIDHLCRVTCCVNPQHLEPVTHKVNVRRGRVCDLHDPDNPVHPNSRKTACLRGHPLSGSNLHISPSGSRICRTCRLRTLRRSRQRTKENV
jgi:hypothetical protein